MCRLDDRAHRCDLRDESRLSQVDRVPSTSDQGGEATKRAPSDAISCKSEGEGGCGEPDAAVPAPFEGRTDMKVAFGAYYLLCHCHFIMLARKASPFSSIQSLNCRGAGQKVDTRARKWWRTDRQKGGLLDPGRGQNSPLQMLRRATHRPLDTEETESEIAQCAL